MPVVEISMWPGRDKDTKRKLIRSVYKAVQETLDIPMDWIKIIINEVPEDNWGIDGRASGKN